MCVSPPLCAATFDAGARAELEYRLCARQRGRFDLTHVDVRVRPVLGLFYKQYRLALPAELHVYPNLVNIQRYELLLRNFINLYADYQPSAGVVAIYSPRAQLQAASISEVPSVVRTPALLPSRNTPTRRAGAA